MFRKRSISDAALEVDSFYNAFSHAFFSHSADPVTPSLKDLLFSLCPWNTPVSVPKRILTLSFVDPCIFFFMNDLLRSSLHNLILPWLTQHGLHFLDNSKIVLCWKSKTKKQNTSNEHWIYNSALQSDTRSWVQRPICLFTAICTKIGLGPLAIIPGTQILIPAKM